MGGRGRPSLRDPLAGAHGFDRTSCHPFRLGVRCAGRIPARPGGRSFRAIRCRGVAVPSHRGGPLRIMKTTSVLLMLTAVSAITAPAIVGTITVKGSLRLDGATISGN